MNNSDYTFPGFAAIALAILFPLYWITLIFSGVFDSGFEFYRSTIEFTLSDVLFLLVGILTIYVYLCIKRLLNEQFGFSAGNVPLNILIACSAVYTFGLLGLDASMAIFGESMGLGVHKFALTANYTISIVCMLVFGVADIILGVLLLRSAISEPAILKVFAIVVIIQGMVELTIVFSPVLIIIFPITLIVMAILFMQKPEVLEVI